MLPFILRGNLYGLTEEKNPVQFFISEGIKYF